MSVGADRCEHARQLRRDMSETISEGFVSHTSSIEYNECPVFCVTETYHRVIVLWKICSATTP